ncbi:MAG: porin family protein [Vicinamibacterales bacterium]
MRKGLLATMVVMSMVGFVRTATAGDVSWGIKGGVISASIATSGPGAFETSADSGIAAGAFVGMTVGKGFSFQPEVLLTTRRFSATIPATSFSVATTGIEVPLLLHVRVPGNRRWQATLFAGPQVGFIPSVTQVVEGVRTNIADEIRNVDMGAVVGGGVEVLAGRGALVLDARVTLGLRNVSETPAPRFGSRAFLAMIGYRF